MNKVFVVTLILGLMVVAGATYSLIWSNPSVKFSEPTQQPPKEDCPREEWNNNFELFRAGEISKEDMKVYVRSCKW
jgi:hypothetical protein